MDKLINSFSGHFRYHTQKKISNPVQQQVFCELDSDHDPVIITFTNKPVTSHFNENPIKRKMNWNLFQKHLNIIFVVPKNLNNSEDIDAYINEYNSNIIEAVHKSIHTNTKRKKMGQKIMEQNSQPKWQT